MTVLNTLIKQWSNGKYDETTNPHTLPLTNAPFAFNWKSFNFTCVDGKEMLVGLARVKDSEKGTNIPFVYNLISKSKHPVAYDLAEKEIKDNKLGKHESMMFAVPWKDLKSWYDNSEEHEQVYLEAPPVLAQPRWELGVKSYSNNIMTTDPNKSAATVTWAYRFNNWAGSSPLCSSEAMTMKYLTTAPVDFTNQKRVSLWLPDIPCKIETARSSTVQNVKIGLADRTAAVTINPANNPVYTTKLYQARNFFKTKSGKATTQKEYKNLGTYGAATRSRTKKQLDHKTNKKIPDGWVVPKGQLRIDPPLGAVSRATTNVVLYRYKIDPKKLTASSVIKILTANSVHSKTVSKIAKKAPHIISGLKPTIGGATWHSKNWLGTPTSAFLSNNKIANRKVSRVELMIVQRTTVKKKASSTSWKWVHLGKVKKAPNDAITFYDANGKVLKDGHGKAYAGFKYGEKGTKYLTKNGWFLYYRYNEKTKERNYWACRKIVNTTTTTVSSGRAIPAIRFGWWNATKKQWVWTKFMWLNGLTVSLNLKKSINRYLKAVKAGSRFSGNTISWKNKKGQYLSSKLSLYQKNVSKPGVVATKRTPLVDSIDVYFSENESTEWALARHVEIPQDGYPFADAPVAYDPNIDPSDGISVGGDTAKIRLQAGDKLIRRRLDSNGAYYYPYLDYTRNGTRKRLMGSKNGSLPWSLYSFVWDGSLEDVNRWTTANLQADDINSSMGPDAQYMTTVDSRCYFWGDASKPYRLYIGGDTSMELNTAEGCGGGWFDLDPGSNLVIQRVHKFKTTSGASIVTVLTSDVNGVGKRFNLVEDEITLSNELSKLSWIPEEIANQVGTLSPWSSVVCNDGMYTMTRFGLSVVTNQMEYNSTIKNQALSDYIKPVFSSRLGKTFNNTVLFNHEDRLYFCLANPDNGQLDNVIFVYDFLNKAFWTYTVHPEGDRFWEADSRMMPALPFKHLDKTLQYQNDEGLWNDVYSPTITSLFPVDYENFNEGVGIATRHSLMFIPTHGIEKPIEESKVPVLIKTGEVSTQNPAQSTGYIEQLEFRFDYFCGDIDIDIEGIDHYGVPHRIHKRVYHEEVMHDLIEYVKVRHLFENYNITIKGNAAFRLTHWIIKVYPQSNKIGLVYGFDSRDLRLDRAGNQRRDHHYIKDYNSLRDAIMP